MRYSFPFLATCAAQLPRPDIFGNQGVEAIIFDRQDLFNEAWITTWNTIELACSLYGPKNVTFHFPVNNANYASDRQIWCKLKEALSRANDLDILGIIVHSNRIRKLNEWKQISLEEDRKIVIDSLELAFEKTQKNTWLGLENMPVMDNYGIEIDPLFVFPSDFKKLKGTPISIVWDICHYSNSLENIKEVIEGKQNAQYYPNIKQANPFDFCLISDQIVHWHFSGFKGVANPDNGSNCKEGVLPNESTLGEDIYKDYLLKISQNSREDALMVFEVQENNYENRINTIAMLEWANKITSAFVS